MVREFRKFVKCVCIGSEMFIWNWDNLCTWSEYSLLWKKLICLMLISFLHKYFFHLFNILESSWVLCPHWHGLPLSLSERINIILELNVLCEHDIYVLLLRIHSLPMEDRQPSFHVQCTLLLALLHICILDTGICSGASMFFPQFHERRIVFRIAGT